LVAAAAAAAAVLGLARASRHAGKLMRRRLAQIHEAQQKNLGRLTAQSSSVERERETRDRLHADSELRARKATAGVGEKLTLREAELAAHKARRARADASGRTSERRGIGQQMCARG
jgi:hypothetical protein